MTLSLPTVFWFADVIPIVTVTTPSTVSFCLFSVHSTVVVGNNSRLPIPNMFNISIPEQSTLASCLLEQQRFSQGTRFGHWWCLHPTLTPILFAEQGVLVLVKLDCNIHLSRALQLLLDILPCFLVKA